MVKSTSTITNQLAIYIQAYMHSRMLLQFQKCGLGGNFRNVTWPYFKPWYYSNNGQKAVPLWAGKGKLRSKHKGSQKRYSRGSKLM